MSNIDSNVFPIDALLSRIQGYFDEVKYKASNHEDFGPMFKFRSLALIAEIYEFVRLYFHRREERLSDYNGMTLRGCLNVIIDIENIQKSLNDLYYNLCKINENTPQNSIRKISENGYSCRSESEFQLQKLYTDGIVGLSNCVCSHNIPTAMDSSLWPAKKNGTDKKFQYATIFHNAHEELDEELVPIEYSQNPDDSVYNDEMKKKSIGNHMAYKVEVGRKGTDGFDVLGYVLDSYHKADGITTDDICEELRMSMEMLRAAFMTDAEDIFYIRTGNFPKLKAKYDEKELCELYSVLPFTQYKKFRQQYIEDYIETGLRWKQENWRTERNYCEEKLSVQQRLDFMNDTKSEVVQQMKENSKLWTIRMHSGGLDSVVTPENFAMMFYRRGEQDFVELQWQYEVLSEKIRLLEIELQNEGCTSHKSIENKTVQEFIDSITLLGDHLYEKWNNKEVSPGAHKANVYIIIKLGELVQYLDDLRENNYDILKEACYPKTAKYKRNFCWFVGQLKAKGYFGELPDNLIADELGPIIGISPGTAANYLVEK